MEKNSEALGTDGPPGFGYRGDSIEGVRTGRSGDKNYRDVAKEINQALNGGYTTQLDIPGGQGAFGSP